ncbi:MAG: hypothetical protein LBP22_10125 [Deltaproteobacteria bacterium]|jgi:hypothetical protein|nr:hypothetical protein [Deltaproteobacteria bacterium]
MKFGSESTSADVVELLQNASPTQIEQWGCRILQVRTTDEGEAEVSPQFSAPRELDTSQDNLPELFNKAENEGKVKGRAEGELKILKRQLKIKFDLDSARADAANLLQNANSEQIELRAGRILQAQTIDEVFVGG